MLMSKIYLQLNTYVLLLKKSKIIFSYRLTNEFLKHEST